MSHAHTFHSGVCRDGSTNCFKCGHNGDFMKECPKKSQTNGNWGNKTQSSSIAPRDIDAPTEDTSGINRGSNHQYVITSRQEQQNSPVVVIGMIKVFNFNVYTLLDPRESLSFVTPYVANKFKILPKNFVNPYVFLHLLGSLF